MRILGVFEDAGVEKEGIGEWVQNIIDRRMVSFVTFGQKRGRHDYQRKLRAAGKGVSESSRIVEHKLKRAAETGGALRHPACVPAGS